LWGGNQKDTHLKNANLNRDFSGTHVADVRYATDQDKCPECGKKIVLENAMELGHIFKLGERYSKPLKAHYLDEAGKQKTIIMGCYGIGINRILAAAVEQSHDTKGIIWPKQLAPFDIEILTLADKSAKIQKISAELEAGLEKAGLEVLTDDREERAGVKFNDADLIGIPIQVVVSERNLKDKKVEVKIRKSGKTEKIDLDKALPEIQKIYTSL